MRKTTQRLAALLFCLLLLLPLLPAKAQADGELDLNRKGQITVRHVHKGVPIYDTAFRLYHVATLNKDMSFSPTTVFQRYPIRMDALDQDGWRDLTTTLTGFIQRDDLSPVAIGQTNDQGELLFDQRLSPGLYLLLGDSKTIDGVVYAAIPTLAVLPGRDETSGEWIYDLTVRPKLDIFDEPAETVTRRVLKIWEDNDNAKAKRPGSITVDLLKDGEVYDTQVLTAADNWRYTWEGLDATAVWNVVEHELSGYTVKVEQRGLTFTVTNSLIPEKYCEDDPPVKKVVTGNTPPSDALFRFSLEAVDNTAGLSVSEMPMPPESDGTIKYKEVYGGGEYEFGIIHFTVPGTYVYKIKELTTGVDGYTYDSAEYTVTYVVKDDAASLTGMSGVRTIARNGVAASEVVFTNSYKGPGPSPTPTTSPSPTPTPTPKPSNTPKPNLPKTGALWWPVLVLLPAGIVLMMFGLFRYWWENNETRE